MSSFLEIHQDLIPSQYLTTNIITFTTTPTTIVRLKDRRSRLVIQNISANTITLGGNSITPGNGYLIPPGNDAVFPIGGDVVVWGCAGSTSSVCQLEML